MGEVNFSCKELSEEPSSATAGSVEETGEKILTAEEKIKEIEDTKEITEFENKIAMWEAYTKIGTAKFLGNMTESGMANLFDKTGESTEEAGEIENIKYELIPEKLVEENGVEYMVYQTTKNYDTESSEAQEIAQNEYNCYVEIQEKIAQEYDSLVESGKMKSLNALTIGEITEYKTKNNISNEKIKEVLCFDENGDVIEGSRLYYEIIN